MTTTRARAGTGWDYVIIGAGSAGCVLAARLTEDPGCRVLLLEAGEATTELAERVPALIQKLGAGRNWLYPMDADASRDGVVEPYSAGRGLGGSSATNHMMWVRGSATDFDGWASEGCDGWDFEHVLPAFRRAERWEGGASRYRGGAGPQRVATMRVPHPTTDAFVRAAARSGFPTNADHNGAVQTGAGIAQVNQRRGLRHSAADAYLRPTRRRPNLVVRAGATATRIVIEDGRAVGVEIRSNGRAGIVRARREVLVSAGAIASPTLLMRSGVGPADALSRLGIAPAVDLPGVGRNLQDHPAVPLVFEVTERTLNQELTPLGLLRHGLDFVLRGRGAVTSTSCHAVAFGPSDASTAPEMQLIFQAFGLTAPAPDAGAGAPGGRLRRMTARSGGREEGRRQVAAEALVTVQAALLHPRVRGEVVLRSADPADPPIVRHALLGDAGDVRELVEAARTAREVFAAPELARIVVAERTPGPAVTSTQDWERYLRSAAFRLFHATSTCRMGIGQDAVVDPRLRVHDVASLRVIDASVMPSITSGNTNAPTIAIAERGSDLVREDAAASV